MSTVEPPDPSETQDPAGSRADDMASFDALQARFLAHMSHELRTPLAGLLGLVDLARRTASDPAQKRYLEVAMQSGRALQRTIANVLDITKLREGPMPLADEAFDLAESVAEVLRGAMPVAREKGLLLRYDWDGEPTWVRGDELRVRQLVGNLVDNAVRFTERGHVELRAHLQDHPDRAGWRWFTLDIEDTGPGLPPQQLQRVFEPFVQGDDSLTRLHGGAGLGLSIARQIAQRVGGSIDARSTPGVGSLFTVTLPMAAASEPDPLPGPAPGLAWLVYARNEGAAWLQRRLLRLGWQSEIFNDGRTAAARATEVCPAGRPSLVIVAEPAAGSEADLAALRAALPTADVRLLIRPEWHQPVIESRARELGMLMDVMPLSPRDLRLMTGHVSAPAVEPHAVQAPPPGPHVLVVEDNPINRMIAEGMLDALKRPWRSVADGAQALADCAIAPPCLVLMDLQMPVLDGLGATRELRARQARGDLPDFPIVALTAHAMSDDIEACRAAGMSGHLAKPLLMDALRQELSRWIADQ